MQKEAAWLLAELNGLVQKGVLDEAAAARLRAHYAQAGDGSRLGWGMILLAIGGAALIGLGIILIFAHNWESWTPEVRVALSFLPLVAGQAACAWALKTGARIWREAAGLFTAIAAGAAIALIAQTYQFGGDLPRFLMTWLLLAAPLIYVLDASAVAAGAWALALGWVFASPNFGWWGPEGTWQHALRLPIFLALFSVPLPHLARHIRLDRGGARVAWLLRVGIVVLAIGLGVTASAYDEDALFVLYGALSAAAALAGTRYFGDIHGLWGNPLLTAGRCGVVIIVLLATVDDLMRNLQWHESPLLLLPLAIGVAAAWLAWRSFTAGDRLVAPLLGLLTPLVFLLPALQGSPLAIVLAHAYALALAGAWIRTGLRTAQLDAANLGAALLAGLILLRFFDSDLSYVVRGVGFIVTGVGFFAAVMWLRRRVREVAA
jgi:hypothetical protein